MKTVTRLIYASLLIAGTFSASTAMACTTALWNGGTEGAPLAGSPSDVSRVSGLCAMELAAAGSVKDTSPAAEAKAIMRFYVFAELNSGTPVIFEAFSDDGATSSLLTVSFDGSDFVFDAGAGASAAVPGNPSGWNLVELDWTGGTAMDYWVNADSLTEAVTGSVTAAAGTMESVILGTRDTYTGTLTFDAYESHRSTPVGALLIGDADGNGEVKNADAIDILIEARPFGAVLTSGQPDCNLDGEVKNDDAIDVLIASRPFGAVPCGIPE